MLGLRDTHTTIAQQLPDPLTGPQTYNDLSTQTLDEANINMPRIPDTKQPFRPGFPSSTQPRYIPRTTLTPAQRLEDINRRLRELDEAEGIPVIVNGSGTNTTSDTNSVANEFQLGDYYWSPQDMTTDPQNIMATTGTDLNSTRGQTGERRGSQRNGDGQRGGQRGGRGRVQRSRRGRGGQRGGMGHGHSTSSREGDAEQRTPEQRTPEERVAEQRVPEQRTPEQGTPEQPDQRSPEQLTQEQRVPEQRALTMADSHLRWVNWEESEVTWKAVNMLMKAESAPDALRRPPMW